MVDILSTHAAKVVALKYTGRVDKHDVDRSAAAIEEKLSTHEKIRIYAELENLEGISIPALIEDLLFSFKHHHQFEKQAIVSDEEWIGKSVPLLDRLLPGVEIKYFPLVQKEQAQEWVRN